MSVLTSEITIHGLWNGPRSGSAAWRSIGRVAGMLAVVAFFAGTVLFCCTMLLFEAIIAWHDPLMFFTMGGAYLAGYLVWRRFDRRRKKPEPPPDDRYGGDLGVRVPAPPSPPLRVGGAENEVREGVG